MNLLTVFSFSMLMPIDTCAIKKKLSKNGYHFALREDKPSSSSLVSHSSQLSHSLRAFALPLLHETSTQSSRKYYPRENRRVPKITLEGLQWVEGRPIWGIHSLSFILSWLPFWIAKPLFFPQPLSLLMIHNQYLYWWIYKWKNRNRKKNDTKRLIFFPVRSRVKWEIRTWNICQPCYSYSSNWNRWRWNRDTNRKRMSRHDWLFRKGRNPLIKTIRL